MTQQPQRILVTGAQGFVGRYLVCELLQQFSTVRVLGTGRSSQQSDTFTHSITSADKLMPAPLPAELSAASRDPRYAYASVDLTDAEETARVVANFRPDWILHLASALRDESPARLAMTNIEGTIQLINAAQRVGAPAPRIVLGSSGAVYGHVPEADLPIDESRHCVPTEPYGISKLAAEQMALILCQRYGLDLVIGRLFNLVGPGQEERHVFARFASQFVRYPDRDRPVPLNVVVGRLDTTRDFLDVRDAAQALVLLAQRGAPSHAYNIASGRETSIEEVLNECRDLVAADVRVVAQSGEPRPGDVRRHVARVDKLRTLGFRLRHDWRDSLREILEFYRYVSCISANPPPHRYREKGLSR